MNDRKIRAPIEIIGSLLSRATNYWFFLLLGAMVLGLIGTAPMLGLLGGVAALAAIASIFVAPFAIIWLMVEASKNVAKPSWDFARGREWRKNKLYRVTNEHPMSFLMMITMLGSAAACLGLILLGGALPFSMQIVSITLVATGLLFLAFGSINFAGMGIMGLVRFGKWLPGVTRRFLDKQIDDTRAVIEDFRARKAGNSEITVHELEKKTLSVSGRWFGITAGATIAAALLSFLPGIGGLFGLIAFLTALASFFAFVTFEGGAIWALFVELFSPTWKLVRNTEMSRRRRGRKLQEKLSMHLALASLSVSIGIVAYGLGFIPVLGMALLSKELLGGVILLGTFVVLDLLAVFSTMVFQSIAPTSSNVRKAVGTPVQALRKEVRSFRSDVQELKESFADVDTNQKTKVSGR